MIHQLWPEPGIIASHVTRIYQSLTKPYASVAEAFERGDYRGLVAEVEIAQPVWCMVSEYMKRGLRIGLFSVSRN